MLGRLDGMHYIIGLGNPGKRYRLTRHNIGFRVVDKLAHQQRARWSAGSGEYLAADHADRKYRLIKPLTYMNNSGQVLSQLRNTESIPLGSFLVIYDDLDLPLGRLRFRPEGSAGTHRGMQSIVEHADSRKIPRLRIGIGSPNNTEPAEKFVLQPFTKHEEPIADQIVDLAAEAITEYIETDMGTMMNKYNHIDVTQ